MRATPIVRAFAVALWAVAFAAACSVLAASSAAGRFIATPPRTTPACRRPSFAGLTPASITESVEAAARFAHRGIGGRNEDDK
jgi:hypothetical protein